MTGEGGRVIPDASYPRAAFDAGSPSREAVPSSVPLADDPGRRLIGASAPMQAVYGLIDRVAGTLAPVLISGETGTGKEIVAQRIHSASRRRDQLFLPVNCGAVSATLSESELFGHERGSFTGADRTHRGYFERADRGTLFLDEIAEMPIELQAKMLRVLETLRRHPAGRHGDAEGRRPHHRRHQPGAARKRSPRDASARTCSTASTSSRSSCHPCVSAARTCGSSPGGSWRS